MNTIQALIEAEKKATAGPWDVNTAKTANANYSTGCGPWALAERDDPQVLADAQFIAAARNAMPAIIEQDRKYRELVGLCLDLIEADVRDLPDEEIEVLEKRIRAIVCE